MRHIKAKPEALRQSAEMNAIHKRTTENPTSAAAWPTSVSLLAQMVDACQRCDAAAVCDDWLVRVSGDGVAPQFCLKADVSAPAKV